MKFASLLAPVVLAAVAFAQDTLTLNTPTSGPVVCQPLLITWTGGTPPYILSVHDGANPNGPAIQTLGTDLTGNSLTWQVNVSPGSIGLKIIDSTGAISQTSSFDILSGSDTSCVGQSVSGSEGTAEAPSTTAGGGTTSAGATGTTTGGASPTTTRPSTTGTGTGTGTGTATGSSASQSDTNTDAAYVTAANGGLAGLAAAAVLALVAY